MIQVVGGGRIGCFFHQVSSESVLYTRADDLSALSQHPTVICTRITDLAQLLPKISPSIYPHLIFLQNGFYDQILQDYGIRHVTKLLLYIAIPHKGDDPNDGGQSVVTGKYSDMLCQLFCENHLQLRAASYEEFTISSMEKLIWLCVFGLLCDIYKISVGDVVYHHLALLRELIKELQGVAAQIYPELYNDPTLCDRVVDYARSLGSCYAASLKEYDFRNGWFLQRKQTPLHIKLMQEWKTLENV